MLRGAGVVFFAYIGFDAVSTAAQEAKNPQARHADRHPRIVGDVHDPLHPGVGLLTRIVPYTQLDVPDPVVVGIR